MNVQEPERRSLIKCPAFVAGNGRTRLENFYGRTETKAVTDEPQSLDSLISVNIARSWPARPRQKPVIADDRQGPEIKANPVNPQVRQSLRPRRDCRKHVWAARQQSCCHPAKTPRRSKIKPVGKPLHEKEDRSLVSSRLPMAAASILRRQEADRPETKVVLRNRACSIAEVRQPYYTTLARPQERRAQLCGRGEIGRRSRL